MGLDVTNKHPQKDKKEGKTRGFEKAETYAACATSKQPQKEKEGQKSPEVFEMPKKCRKRTSSKRTRKESNKRYLNRQAKL